MLATNRLFLPLVSTALVVGCGGGGSSTSNESQTGQLAVWTNQSSGWTSIDVKVNRQSFGTLTQYMTSAPTSCSQNGAVAVKTLDPGVYSIQADTNTGLVWTSNTTIVAGRCTTIQLQAQSLSSDVSGGNNGGGSGSGGSNSGVDLSKYGRSASLCIKDVTRASKSQVPWYPLPSPFDGLDVRFVWSQFFEEYTILFRNRYQDQINFTYRPSVGVAPEGNTSIRCSNCGTSGRKQMRSGNEDPTPGVGLYPATLTDGGTGCVLVDSVRFGVDDGPYF